MVQILPQEQTMGGALGSALGGGFQQGFTSGLSNYMDQYFTQKKQAAEQQRKDTALQKFFDSPEGKTLSSEEKSFAAIESKFPGLGKTLLEHRRKEKENTLLESIFSPEENDSEFDIDNDLTLEPEDLEEPKEPEETELPENAIPQPMTEKDKKKTSGLTPTKLRNMTSNQLDMLENKGGKFASAAKRERTRRVKGEKAKTEELKPAKEFLKEVSVKYDRAKQLEPVFEGLENTIRKGGADFMTYGSWADMLEKSTGTTMGPIIGGMLRANESADTATFRTLSKQLLAEMKDIFGGQVRVSEFQAFLSLIPQLGKSREANLAATRVLKKASQMSKRYYETARDIIDKNNGEIPANLADLTRKRLDKEMKAAASDMNAMLKETKKDMSKGKVKGVNVQVGNRIFENVPAEEANELLKMENAKRI